MKTGQINNRRDLLLLLLYSPGQSGEFNEPIVGRTRIVKLLFLFKEEALPHFKKGTGINEENFYQFFPWNFGPFSVQVYDDITFFLLRDYVTSSLAKEETIPEEIEEWGKWLTTAGVSSTSGSEEYVTEYVEEEFQLTEKGIKFTRDNLWSVLNDKQKGLLKEFKSKMSKAPLRAILRYVYKNYDHMTENSVIRDEIVGS